ncbi:MAG: hypothetical protein FJ255_10795 [Phycisphaerae bacterium]|nr:hypothetical protein [Phycisphaerae bacterium]
MRPFSLPTALLAVAPGAALAGPDWIETGDAGSFVTLAQPVVGTGELRSIQGTLGASLAAPDLVDMFLVRVLTPTRFRFDTIDVGFDTQLFIFTVIDGKGGPEAFGLLGNDDTIVDQRRVPGSLIDGPANDGSGARISKPGVYALAICGRGRSPTAVGKDIFNFAKPTEISGPDGAAGTQVHDGWEGVGDAGRYRILVEGVGYVDVPAPSTVALAPALILLRRRRRS